MKFKKGHKHSEETKRKIGLVNSIALKGHCLSEETKKKMSKSHIENSWNRGKVNVYSKEALEKMSKAKLGKPSPRKGVKLTIEQRKKLSEVHMGIKNSEESKIKVSISLKKAYAEGRHKRYHDFYTRQKISKSLKGHIAWNKGIKTGIKHNKQFKKGQKPWNYIDGRSKFLPPARYGDDWEKIRYLVYIRDNFMCQDCGIQKKSLDIHHKIPYLFSGDNSIENLITLCRACHMKEESKIRKEHKKINIEVMSF